MPLAVCLNLNCYFLASLLGLELLNNGIIHPRQKWGRKNSLPTHSEGEYSKVTHQVRASFLRIGRSLKRNSLLCEMGCFVSKVISPL